MWRCICECGAEKIVTGTSLRNGRSTSCKHGQTVNVTHGLTGSPEMYVFSGAKNRCTKPSDKAYRNYGGRGIEFRFTSFQQFIDTLGFRPTPQHSLDRIDNNGHYEVGNVRWATRKEQANNTRKTRYITVGDETLPMSAWAAKSNINRVTIWLRLNRDKWCDTCSVTLPPFDKCSHF